MKRLLLKWIIWLMGDPDQAGPLKRKMGALFLRHFPGQITCAEFEAFVLDYHEGALGDRQRRLFDFHMTICPMCRVYFEGYLRTIELGRKVFGTEEESVPDDVPEELVKAILAARADS